MKQGQLYHQNITSFTNVVQILGFNFSALEPRDIATGLPSGKTQFTPLTLYKEMDVSSPLLMQALSNNEMFQATITAIDPATSQCFYICLRKKCLPIGL
jgi:type VI secretion system Hcp family effector